MEITTGSVVTATAGRDKDGVFAVIGFLDSRTALIADGKSRPIERPKRKNIRHLKPLSATVDCTLTNRQLRITLKSYTQGG